LYFGTYCTDKQNLTNSILFGIISGVITFLFTIIFMWSDWPVRAAELFRRIITERAIETAR